MRGDRLLLARDVDRRWSRGRRRRRGTRVRDSERELTQGISLRLTRRNPPQCRSPAQPDRPRGEIPRRVSAGVVRRVCARDLNVSSHRGVRRQRAVVSRAPSRPITAADGAAVVIVTLRSRADASAFSSKIVALCGRLAAVDNMQPWRTCSARSSEPQQLWPRLAPPLNARVNACWRTRAGERVSVRCRRRSPAPRA